MRRLRGLVAGLVAAVLAVAPLAVVATAAPLPGWPTGARIERVRVSGLPSGAEANARRALGLPTGVVPDSAAHQK